MRITVVGDALLDVDVDGAAYRLAPDAPVPVLEDATTSARPGGAALAAAFLVADGVETTLVTAIGHDRAGRRLQELLADFGVQVCNIVASGATPQKARIRAGGHCLVRIDRGSTPPRLSSVAIGEAARQIAAAPAVLVADYGRGVVASAGLRAAMETGVRRRVVWDPHPNGPPPVRGVHLVTPNAREAARAHGDERELSYPAGAADAAQFLRDLWAANAVAVTCGERGAVVATGDDVPMAIPAIGVAGDTCGAGDRFASVAARVLAAGASAGEAARDAVVAATEFVRNRELAHFSHAYGARREAPMTLVATSGCFDLLHAGHLSALRAARALGDRLVVCLNSDASVRRLKGPGRPVVEQSDREAVLRGLACVDDVVVFDEDTPLRVLDALRPAIFVKGGDYDAATLPEAALLRSWGGRTVVVPYLRGRSTTRILEEARNGRQ